MDQILFILQIAIPIALITFILLQQRGQALGSLFGGEGGGFYLQRRGLEEKIFWGTVVLGAGFLVVSLLNLLIK